MAEVLRSFPLAVEAGPFAHASGGSGEGIIGRGATDWYHPWDSGSGDRLHGTILHFMGFDYEKLRYRLGGYNYRSTDVHSIVVKEILT